jgi:hypothetical protein
MLEESSEITVGDIESSIKSAKSLRRLLAFVLATGTLTSLTLM